MLPEQPPSGGTASAMLVAIIRQSLASTTDCCRRMVFRCVRPVAARIILHEATRQHALQRSIDSFLLFRLPN